MAIYSWRKLPTKYFGKVWVPLARIELQNVAGRFQAFALQIDSGATVSLLRRSVADLLHIDLESGRHIDLTGVGGAQTSAYVHDLPTRLDHNSPPLTVPFAIAAVETVPNLLGRLGVFDRLQVDFDASVRETRITGPWIGEQELTVWNAFLETEQSILNRWDQLDWSEPVREATRKLIKRASQVFAAAVSMVKLHRSDIGPLLVRPLMEVSFQFEYLMQNPGTLAQEYLDYEHVARHQREQVFLSEQCGSITRMLAASPLREDGQKKVKAEFDRVKHLFTNSKGKIAKSWYRMSVRDLATRVNREDDYRLWYAEFSCWAHGNPFMIDRNDSTPGTDLMLWCYIYYARMLLEVSDKMILTDEQYQLLKKLAEGLT